MTEYEELIAEAREAHEGCNDECFQLRLADALEAAERQLDEFEAREKEWQERAWQERAEQLNREYIVRGEILSAAMERAEKAERERDEAVADNAALRTAILDIRSEPWIEGSHRVVPKGQLEALARAVRVDAPGAALLARMERLETIAEATAAPCDCDYSAANHNRPGCHQKLALDALSESEATG